MKVRFLGHACFLLQENNIGLIIDPFLESNPLAPVKASQITANYVLVSHAHFDHDEDALNIAKKEKATIISTAEIAGHYEQQGVDSHAMHIGGKHGFDFGYVRLTPALHGAGIEGGHACGFIVNFFGHVVYHTGDTGLFGDMKLLGELEDVELALVPIGDNFVMGIGDAVRAVKMINPKKVIPMHYNTWPVIQADAVKFKEKVEAETSVEVMILEPGKEIEL